jgi:hypothetical protein
MAASVFLGIPALGGDAPHPLMDVSAREVMIRGEGRAIFSSEYSRAVRTNGRGQYDVALAAAQRARDHDDLGVYGAALSELVEAATRMLEHGLAAEALAQLSERTRVAANEMGPEARFLAVERMDHVNKSRRSHSCKCTVDSGIASRLRHRRRSPDHRRCVRTVTWPRPRVPIVMEFLSGGGFRRALMRVRWSNDRSKSEPA